MFGILAFFSLTRKNAIAFHVLDFFITYFLRSWKQKCVDSELTSEELDELTLMDHDEIMSRLTLKQEVKPMCKVLHVLYMYRNAKF